MKTRCVRRLEGENAWDLQFLNLCVGSPWEGDSKEHAALRAKRVYLRQNKYGRTAGCPGCVGNGQHTEECRARTEQEMVDKGDAIKIETGEEIGEEPSVSLKERKNWRARYQSRQGVKLNDRHPRAENLSKDPVQEMRIYWRVRCGCQQTSV